MKTLQEIAESLEKKGFRKEAFAIRIAGKNSLLFALQKSAVSFSKKSANRVAKFVESLSKKHKDFILIEKPTVSDEGDYLVLDWAVKFNESSRMTTVSMGLSKTGNYEIDIVGVTGWGAGDRKKEKFEMLLSDTTEGGIAIEIIETIKRLGFVPK